MPTKSKFATYLQRRVRQRDCHRWFERAKTTDDGASNRLLVVLAADLGCLLLIAAVCKLGYIANLVMISKKASKVIAAK